MAQQFGEFRLRFDAIMAQALRLAGDPERVRNLEARAQTAVLRGVRAEIAQAFRSHNLAILEVPDQDADFQSVVEGELRSAINVLQVILYTGNAAVPGRATFRCTTNIGGLMSMHLKVGEIVSLPVENPDVQRMIAAGALELVDAQKLLTEAHA